MNPAPPVTTYRFILPLQIFDGFQGNPLRAEFHLGYWLDIGRPDDYQRAIEEWPTLKTKLGL